jgi:hypothetical protein
LTGAAARITLPAMRDIMILQVPSLCCSAHVRYIPVSLPRIDALVADMPSKYALPPTSPDGRPVTPPRRGARYTSHDNSTLIKRRLA